MAIPLSLQQSCLLKIICDFETFPPESLALLPLTLRHKLACNLPAVDVCQLEQTSFAQGLEMDEVWSHLAEKAIKVCSKGKDGYFSYVCTLLLNHSVRDYRTVIRKLLFSIKDCLSIVDCSTFEHHLQLNYNVVIPYRHQESYRQFASGGHSDAQLVRFILQNTHCLPKSLTIHCKEFARCIRSESWANENWKVLVEYLSGVHKLSLHFCQYGTTFAVPGFIFNAMSARGCRQLQLEEISFLDSDSNNDYCDLLEETLISVGYYLKRDSGLQCGSCDSLREVHVEGGPDYECSDSTARELSDIIENQPSIRKIWLRYENLNVPPSHHVSTPGHRRLCSTLSRVLQLTQFTYMHLEGVTLLPAGLQQLLYSFLTTPCHHTQTLSLTCSLSHDLSGFVNDLSCCHPDDSNVLYKKLYLKNLFFPDAIAQWLSNHVCLRLNTLDLDDISCPGNLPFVLPSLSLEVKNLTVSVGDPSEVPDDFQWQSGCFYSILGSSLLNELKLSCFGVLVSNATLLLELISGIFKQVRVGMLETLNLQSNRLGSLPDAQLILLFEAILSLPQLERFTLDLSENSLGERQLKLLYHLWQEKCGGRKLKELICCDTVQDASFYQDIAVQLNI